MINDEKREIGSEFWLEDAETNIKYNTLEYLNFGSDNKFLLSGRTAIDFVLEEILMQKKITSVYFPSYCCDSMLQPFIDKNINIEFYNVYYEDGLKYQIDTSKKCDIFYAMNYFGYTSTNMSSYIEEFKKQGAIVIEDITHSLLSEKAYSEASDYLIASLRKWFPIMSGGLAVNTKGKFILQSNFNEHEKIKAMKKDAMEIKSKYMKNDVNIEKSAFLDKYKEANQLLEREYKNYSMDADSLTILQSLNVKEIREARRNNAKVIYDRLKNANIKFLVSTLNEEDAPLFVPILLNPERKEKLKTYLVEHEVFCPSHWKKPAIVENSELYTNEISLICDQRYTEKEVERYIGIVAKFLKEC